MPQKTCCVPTCASSLSAGAVLHAFPNPTTESGKFHTWVVNAGLVGEDYDYIYLNRRICRLHFENIYHYPKNRLSKFAIPTLHLPENSIHQFPHPEKNPDRFKAWVHIAGGKLDSPTDYELYRKKVICDIHFSDQDRNRNNRLNFLAVPSLHLPDCDRTELSPTTKDEESSLPASPLPPSSLQLPSSRPTHVPFVFRRKYDPDVPICRACLTTKRKLYNIHETDVLDIYQQMSGTQVTEDDCLSKLLCSHCVTLLRKCNTFSQNCKEAAKALKEATFTNYLPEASKVQNLKFYRTNINHIDIVGGNCVKMEINQDNDGDTMVDDTGVSEPMDIANEIEIKDVNKIRKKKPNVLDDENKLKDFEDTCNVDVHKLSSEEKLQDVLDRKSTPNYLNSPHRCELCFKGFLAANLLTNHFLMHHDPSLGSEVCEYCQFRYKTANDLSAHYTTRHTTKMSCRLCPKVSRNVFEAKKHHDVYHNGQKYTTCEHCGRGFRVQSTFLVHLRDEHPSELIWCNVCGDSFVLAETLDKHKQRRHRDIHLPVQCERCDVQLADEAALDRHSLDGVCTGHTCLHCGLGYNDAMALRDHIIKTHRKTSNMLYPCPKCHKVYKQGAQLRDHLKYVHLKLNRKVICEICGKVVPNKNAMKVHLRVHTGERPYECPVCMKGFISKDTMMKHRNYVHSTARPYVCDRCPKSFKGKHNLTQHERAVHDNETTTASQTLLSLGLIL